MKEVIQRIIEQEYGIQLFAFEEIVGKGKNNAVYKIIVDDCSYILRLQKSLKQLEIYEKEKWCSEAVRNVGIPTPEIHKVGICEGYTFSIQDFIKGEQSTESKNNIAKIWYTLGQYAKIINSISAPKFAFSYTTFVQGLFKDNFFSSRNIFSQELSLKIQDRLNETTKWEFLPKLCHGNLHPSNVVLSADQIVHLIDWETATGNRTPQSELAEIYTWNTGKENISQFLDGYGLKEKDMKDMIRDVQTLVLLRLLSVIKRKISTSSNWEQDIYIRETAKRLVEIQDYQDDILFTKNL